MDSVVVGGGPAGSIAARTLSRQGEVTLFEEHVTQPVQCAGLISVSGLTQLGVNPRDSVLNEIKGARFISSTGRSVEFRAFEKKAYVVDRRRFDELLLGDACSSGVRVVNERVVGVSKGRVETKRRVVQAEKVVLASGVDYSLHRKLNLAHPRKFLVGTQVDLNVDCEPDFVELHFNVPGFFSWIIPAGDFARVGLCARTNPTPYLNSFMKELKDCGRLKGTNPRNRVYGVIPVYDPRVRADYGFIRCVGDAAGQVKATTGGGVVLGAVAASLVGEENYERAWRDAIGRELYLHLLLRNLVDRVCEKNQNLLFDMLDSSVNAVERGGDMDYASKTVRSLMLNPKFIVSVILHAPQIILGLL